MITDMRDIRRKVKAAYGNKPSWVDRVNRMSDRQVYEIYQSLKKRGQI